MLPYQLTAYTLCAGKGLWEDTDVTYTSMRTELLAAAPCKILQA